MRFSYIFIMKWALEKGSPSLLFNFEYLAVDKFKINDFFSKYRKLILLQTLTDGLLGKPTRWPHVVNRLTRHSRTRDWDIHGRFHPLNGAVSAGDKLALRLGEFGVPVALFVKCEFCPLLRVGVCANSVSDFNKMRRPMSDVWDTSNVNSMVRPASSCGLKEVVLDRILINGKSDRSGRNISIK